MEPIKIREYWLANAVAKLKSGLFQDAGYSIPQVKVSVGFPGGGSAKKRIGEFWTPDASDDKIGSVFISPILDDASRVLDVLVHELVHAVVGVKAGHGPVFRKCAVAVGLTGKMTATTAGEDLKPKLSELIKELGSYPHAKLNLQMRPTKKQTTRMIKMSCESCEYIVRTSQKNIDQHGPVTCPCGETMVTG